MNARGHNERSYRLDALASEAREGLASVEKGEEFTIGGWLAYGHALNEGRALFPSNEQFGQWVKGNLPETEQKVREAAMWAAGNADQFEEARQRGNPRTIRGIHAKWKEIEAERELQEQEEKRLEQLAQARPVSNDDQEESASETSTVEAEQEPAPKPDQETARQQPTEPEPDRSQIGAGPEPDPDAKLRSEYRSLTDEAREEDWISLRAQAADDRKRIEKQRSEIADLKQQVKELSDKDDPARKLAAKQKQLLAANYARDEAMTKAKRFEYRMKQAEKERDEMRRQFEAQEIRL